MGKKTHAQGVITDRGHATHWWAALPNIPESLDSLAYRRLRTLWGDQTRKRVVRGDPYQEFLAPRTETNITATLWENFALFPASTWLPELLRIGGSTGPEGAVDECQWSYGWSIGGRPNKILDVVIHARTADGRARVVVVEAKRPGNPPKGKDLELPYYLDVPALRDVADDRCLLFCVDEGEEARLRRELQDRTDRRWLVTTWQQVGALQIRLARSLEVPGPIRNFVAGAIQYQFCQHNIRPAALSADYLAGEPSGHDCITKRLGDGLKEFPPTKTLWRLPEPGDWEMREEEEPAPVRQEAIAAILVFLPTFESSGLTFGRIDARAGEFGHVQLSSEVMAFHQALYDHGWVSPFDWSSFQDEAIGYFENPTLLEKADISTIRKLLTLHARKDRFCDGHLMEMLEKDHIQAILRRLAKLKAEMPHR